MKAMETTAYYAFGVPLYLLLIWIEARRAKQRGMPALNIPLEIATEFIVQLYIICSTPLSSAQIPA